MKIWLYRYELQSRQGALLKIEWSPGQTGFSDLHPWPSLGDQKLEEHIQSLEEMKFTPLAARSVQFNLRDSEYRRMGRNAFLGLGLPTTHHLLREPATEKQAREWTAEGFTHLKTKRFQVPFQGAAWRFDFNGRLSRSEFLQWWTGLSEAEKARIDFVEDPGAVGISGPWARDWFAQSDAKIRIVKPARESTEGLEHFERVVFTHSLDHPLGQACALWAAARYYARHPERREVCGLAAHAKVDGFSELWHCTGPRMKPTPGIGFGFDDLLHDLRWEKLL